MRRSKCSRLVLSRISLPVHAEAEQHQIQTFDLPISPGSCAVSPSGTVYLAAEEGSTVYSFQAAESTAAPTVEKALGQIEGEVTGLAVYVAPDSSYYLFVAQSGIVDIYSPCLQFQGSMELIGAEDIEVAGMSVYQRASTLYPDGILGYALETESGEAYGISSLEPAFAQLGLEPNTSYTPRSIDPSLQGPQKNGFVSADGTISCFAGFTGTNCSQATCENACSYHGACVGPNECQCNPPWAGPDCSWIGAEPKYETDAHGRDGDDPAIWISPVSPDQSTIITATKSEVDSGLAVFDVAGNLLQTVAAGEPNNVDVIYGFQAGSRKIDLSYAACREDDTLWYETPLNQSMGT